MSWRPSPTSRPQLTTLGSPRPRKDTADSNRMAPATTSDDSTITGGRALGRISVTMIFKSPMPMERQACTNSRSRSARNSARVMRAIGVQLTTPMAMHDVVERRAQDHHDGEHEDQVGNGLEQLGEPHHDLVDPAAEVAGRGPHADADEGGDGRGEQADQQGRPGAVHDHGRDIAARANRYRVETRDPRPATAPACRRCAGGSPG